jgi:hypothetical protein
MMGRGSASRPISFSPAVHREARRTRAIGTRYAWGVSVDVTRAIDELYGVPPKDFSSARNEKAAALKAAGHAAEAQVVRRLAKPSPFLWATNQLARLHPERVSHFIDLVGRVRQSQLRDPRTAAEGMQTIRAELHALTSRATEVLTKAGYRVPASGAARISNTVLGAAVDPDLVDRLRHGRLATEVAAPGFEVLSGAQPGRSLQLLRGGKISERQHLLEQAGTRRNQAQAERAPRAQEAEARRREAEQRAAAAERAADEVRELERQLADARRKLRNAQRDAVAAADRARRQTDS